MPTKKEWLYIAMIIIGIGTIVLTMGCQEPLTGNVDLKYHVPRVCKTTVQYNVALKQTMPVVQCRGPYFVLEVCGFDQQNNAECRKCRVDKSTWGATKSGDTFTCKGF